MLNMAALWKPVCEILILWFVYYRIMLFFEGTRAVQVLRGIVILVFLFFLVQVLRFETLDWLFTRLFAISVIGILIIFQPEIRYGLARLGQRNIFKVALHDEEIHEMLHEIVDAIDSLSKTKTGAIIAIEREDHLKAYVDSGVVIDGKVNSELIQTIFTPNSLLHDGGIVIRNGRLIAAGCLFPLADRADLSRVLGTRHRAALGLVEETDAVVVIVSEESGAISLCLNGKLIRDIDTETLFKNLKSNFKPKKNSK